MTTWHFVAVAVALLVAFVALIVHTWREAQRMQDRLDITRVDEYVCARCGWRTEDLTMRSMEAMREHLGSHEWP